MVEKALIVGVGLIGSSLARALRERGLARVIVGADQSADVLDRARRLGVIDAGADVGAGLRGADLVVVAVPVGAIGGVLRAVTAQAEDGALVIDVGSVKRAVVEAALALEPRAHIVPPAPSNQVLKPGSRVSFRTAGASSRRSSAPTPPIWRRSSARRRCGAPSVPESRSWTPSTMTWRSRSRAICRT
jgi:cyclohexadieny/prephenate dehydrogenase